jgi:hypothetical protein
MERDPRTQDLKRHSRLLTRYAFEARYKFPLKIG